MKNFIIHTRKYFLRGLLAIIPLVLCYFATKLLYILIDRKFMRFLDKFVDIHQIPGLGIILLLVCLYFIGVIASNIVGRQFLGLIEGISTRIPLINTIYSVGKQLSQGISEVDSEKKAFKKAVLVKLNNDGLLAPFFVVNSLIDRKTNEEILLGIIPGAPTPAHGYLFAVNPSQTVDPKWTVEECLKTVVSVGIVTPKEIKS